MPNLQRIQECIDLIEPILDEIASFIPVRIDVRDVNKEVLHIITKRMDHWKKETDEVLAEEILNYSPELNDFNYRWNKPILNTNVKAALTLKLRNARTDLRHLVREIREEESPRQREIKQPEFVITEYGKKLMEEAAILEEKGKDVMVDASIAQFMYQRKSRQ